MLRIFCLLLLVSCSVFQSKVRTEQTLMKFDDLIVSNTQTNPYKVEIDDGEVHLKYKILLKNISDKPIGINTSMASLTINDEVRKLWCKSHSNPTPPYLIKPQSYLALTCIDSFKPNSKNKIAKRDTDIKLIIPLYSGRAINFKYRLFIEDFE